MPDQPPCLRCFKPEDLDELHRIDSLCFPAHIAFSRDELLFHLHRPKSITRVAEKPGMIVGFVLAGVATRKQAHIITLDVVPEARRQRIGTMLMNEIHRELANIGIDTIVLEVGVGNTSAQRLYRGLCYQYAGRLPGYYCGQEDALRMVRRG